MTPDDTAAKRTEEVHPYEGLGQSAFLRRASGFAVVIIALVLVGWVHSSIIGFTFHADDYLHLYAIELDALPDFLLKPHGGHALSVWRTVFLLEKSVFGLETELWFGSSLVVHLLNTGLVIGCAWLISGRITLSAVIGALWGSSPLARGTIGWVSVHSNLLMTTWTLLALFDVLRVARSGRSPSHWAIARWLLLMLAAANSFGMGILVAMVFPAFVWLILERQEETTRAIRWLWSLPVLVPVLYFLNLNTMSLPEVERVDMLAGVELTVRLLLTAIGRQILCLLDLFAVGLSTVWPGALVAVGIEKPFSVAVGPLAGTPVEAVRGWLRVEVGVFALGLSLILPRLDRRSRFIVLGLLALAICNYIPTALARAGMPGLPPWIRPRYQYLGPALIWLSLTPLILRAWDLPLRTRGALLALAAGWVLLTAGIAPSAANSLGNGAYKQLPRRLERSIQIIERAVVQSPPGSTVYLRNRPYRLMGMMPEHWFPGFAGVFVIAFEGEEIEGRRVRFVETDQRVLEYARRRGRQAGIAENRISRILISESEADGPIVSLPLR